MKTKILSSLMMGIFSILILTSLASADLVANPTSITSSIEQGSSYDFSFTLLNNDTLDFGNATISYSQGTLISDRITLNQESISLLSSENSMTISGTITIPISQPAGNYNGNIRIAGEYDGTPMISDKLIPVSITVTEVPFFCSSGAIDDEDLILEVKVKNRGNGEVNEWQPLDKIEVEVELKNNKDDIDLEDVIFELGIFQRGSTTNIADDMIWISKDSEEFEYGDIDEGKRGKHTFEFKIDPREVDEGDYILKVKAYPDGDESETCIDYSDDFDDSDFGSSRYYAEIEVSLESDRDKSVVVDTSETILLESSCNQMVSFSTDIWNIGTRDYEDQIMVHLYNSDLKLDIKEVSLGDLDSGDRTTVHFSFLVPEGAEEKQYTLSMRTFYEYDENDGSYETHYDRVSDDTFYAYLKIEGGCTSPSQVSLVANLESEAKAGEELTVSVTITNNANSQKTYELRPAGYDRWADSLTVSQESITLASGESRVITYTFDLNKDASGSNSFVVDIYTGGQFVATQPFTLSIEGRSAGFLSGITGAVVGSNGYIWVIGLINLILLLAIIILAVKLSRK